MSNQGLDTRMFSYLSTTAVCHSLFEVPLPMKLYRLGTSIRLVSTIVPREGVPFNLLKSAASHAILSHCLKRRMLADVSEAEPEQEEQPEKLEKSDEVPETSEDVQLPRHRHRRLGLK